MKTREIAFTHMYVVIGLDSRLCLHTDMKITEGQILG